MRTRFMLCRLLATRLRLSPLFISKAMGVVSFASTGSISTLDTLPQAKEITPTSSSTAQANISTGRRMFHSQLYQKSPY